MKTFVNRKLSIVMLVWILLVLTSVVLMTCKSEDYFAGSCNVVGTDQCVEYTGSVFTKESVQSGCGAFYLSGPCPTTNISGSCIILEGTPTEYVVRFYSPTFDPASAASMCSNLGGTFVP